MWEKHFRRLKKQDIPELSPCLEIPYMAFWDLCRSRQVGMGPSNIASSDIRAHFDMMGISRSNWPWIYWAVRICDDEYMKWAGETHDKSKGKASGK